jgi:hypothetical protein
MPNSESGAHIGPVACTVAHTWEVVAAIFHHLVFIKGDQSIDLIKLAVNAATMQDNVTILRSFIIKRMLSSPAPSMQ